MFCLDFDGVIHDYASSSKGDVPDGPPVIGAVEAIGGLGEFVVWTSRPEAQAEGVRAWLTSHGLTAAQVIMGKPSALVYVDDRALRFLGSWEETKRALISSAIIRPWWSKPVRSFFRFWPHRRPRP